MRFLTTLIFTFITLSLFSQKTEFTVLDSEDKNPIDDVRFYTDSLFIAKTNKKGIIKFNVKDYSKIIVVKEDYYDTILNSNDLKDKIYLKKINAIKLKEVVVTQLDYNVVLDSVAKNTKNYKLFLSPLYYHEYNLFFKENDTLSYLNKRLLLKKGKGYFVDNFDNIVANYNRDEEGKIRYHFNNNDIVFNLDYNHLESPYNTAELQIVSRLKDKFDYELSKDENHIIIKFLPKKKNREFPYEGYLILDIDNYALLEFKANTIVSDKTNKRNLYYNDEIINYEIVTENSFIKYKKNEQGKYDLVLYAFNSELKALTGDFKGETFINKCRKESTLDFNMENGLPINLSTYKLRE